MSKNYKGIGINTSKNTHETVFHLIGKDRKENQEVSILDIPCGNGALTQRLIDSHYTVISSDIVEGLFSLNTTDFVPSNLNETLPFNDSTFDVLPCVDGIAHVENIPHTFREFSRVLKKDGFLILSTPNISSLRSRFRFFLTGFHNKRKLPLNERHPTPEHLINIIDLPMLKYFLHTNGFTITDIETNRTKAIALLYLFFTPLAFLITFYVFKTEKQKPDEKKINMDFLKSLFKSKVLLGETLIIRAKNIKPSSAATPQTAA